MILRFVFATTLTVFFLGCGSSTPPKVNDGSNSVLPPPDETNQNIGQEGHPCDTAGGCFDDLICVEGICTAPPVVDAGASDGSSDGSSTGEVSDAGAADGNNDGASTGDMVDSGSIDGSSDGLGVGPLLADGAREVARLLPSW